MFIIDSIYLCQFYVPSYWLSPRLLADGETLSPTNLQPGISHYFCHFLCKYLMELSPGIFLGILQTVLRRRIANDHYTVSVSFIEAF